MSVMQPVEVAPGVTVMLVRMIEVPTDDALGVARFAYENEEWWRSLHAFASPAFGQVGRCAPASNHINFGTLRSNIVECVMSRKAASQVCSNAQL